MPNTVKPSRITESRGRRLRLLIVAGAFVVFGFLMTYLLGERECGLDERISAGHVETLLSIRDVFHPPGYYWLLFQWKQVFGGSDLSLRAFSVPWALLALALVWLLARALLRPPHDTLALWLFTLSPFALLYLRMARYFALTMAVALLVAYFALLVRRYGKPHHYLGLAATVVALLWVEYVPCLLVPLVYLWILPSAWRRGGQRYWWLVSALLPLLAMGLRINALLTSYARVSGMEASHLQVSLHGLLLKLSFPFYAALVGETTDFWRLYVVMPVAVTGMILLMVGLVTAWHKREPARWLKLLPWPVTVVLVTILLSTAAASEPWPRVSSLSLFAFPFFLIGLAQGAGALRRSWAVVLVSLFLLGQVYGLTNYLARRQFLNPGYNVPWREVNDLIQAQANPGDVAVTFFDSTLQRYWQGPVKFVDYSWHVYPPVIPEIEEFPHSGGGVWVISRDRGSDYARKLARELLAELTREVGEPQVYRLQPLGPREQHWRSLLLGRPAEEAYLKIYRFSPLLSEPSSIQRPAPVPGSGNRLQP